MALVSGNCFKITESRANKKEAQQESGDAED